ncbi:MAG TPA: hypothetical protein VGQ38_07890 [Gaiellaceae bacterium]|nr:hypothetical protein [Gaiellaceae bacterium]
MELSRREGDSRRHGITVFGGEHVAEQASSEQRCDRPLWSIESDRSHGSLPNDEPMSSGLVVNVPLRASGYVRRRRNASGMASLRLLLASAPVPALPPLIVRLGLHDQFLLDESQGFRMDVIARSMAQAKGDPSLARSARDDYALGVLIDPDTWRNQQPFQERPPSYRKASFGKGEPIDPERRPLSAIEETAYVRAVLAEEAAGRATLFVPPYHLAGGPNCAIRSLDLRLARKFINRFRSLRLDEPRPQDRFPRAGQVFPCVCIRASELLDAASRHHLARLYSKLDADGFIVKVAGLSERSSDKRVRAVADFVFTLKKLSERPVIIAGVKNLAFAFVAAGLDAAMLGIGEGEGFVPGGRAKGGGARPTYIRALLRNVFTENANLATLLRAEILFERIPCDCGHHPSKRPPHGPRERKLHTLTERLRDFNEAAAWAEHEAIARLTARIRWTDKNALRTGFDSTPGTFLAVAEQADLTRRHLRLIARDAR